MEHIAQAVQTALECSHLHRPVLLFQFVWQLKLRFCMVCAILKSSSDTERMLIYRPVPRKCNKPQKGKSWLILILISIL